MIGLFLIAALFDLLPLLPGWLHLALLIGFAVAFALPSGAIWPALRFPGSWRGCGGSSASTILSIGR